MTNIAPPPPVAGYAQPKTSQAALWSMILGILSLVCVGPLAGIPAIICGHVARGNIKNSAGALGGSGMALSGLIMGYLTTILFFLLFVFGLLGAIAIPGFSKAREGALTQRCVNNLRLISDAKDQWALATDAGASSQPGQTDLTEYIGVWPTCPQGGVYMIGDLDTDPTCSVPGHALP